MTGDALSIRAAAQEAGGRAALRVAGRTLSFADVASLVEARIRELAPAAGDPRPFPLVAENTLAVVVTLYALLELRVPVLLIHPRLTDNERADLLTQAARSGPVRHADAAAIIHTSGTTGAPRGAVLTRASLVASATASARNLGWEEDDCWLACMPIGRVGGLSILTRCLVARRCAALAEGFDAASFPALLDGARVTLASVVPTMLARVLDAHPQWRPAARLRAMLVGGAPAPRPLLKRAGERGVPIVLTYGLTETCSQVAATPYRGRHAPFEYGDGVPLAGANVRIADGRIEVAGPMLMAGYWEGPQLDPHAWFDTGDLGTLDEHGCLHVLGRRGDLIVTGGENVYPAEVERVLEACPGVLGAAVFGLPDATWGETVAAALVIDPVHAPRDAELRAWIGERLAPHKRPRRICRVERLPQTVAGKPDRVALAAMAPLLRPLQDGPA
jgi:O-succinylbenzoic acid--CoA ligase